MLRDGYSNDIPITRLQNGDQNNDVNYNRYAFDQELAQVKLKAMLENYDRYVSLPMDLIFTAKIDARLYWGILDVLTFWDAICEARNETFDIYPNDLYFALLVNFSADRQPGIQKIRSYSMLYSAKENAKNNGHYLDYRDYVMNKEGEEEFSGDYIKATLRPRGYNVPFDIEVPVKKVGLKKFGMVKLCSDNVPCRLSFKEDPDGIKYTIPAYLWMAMMKKGVSKFNKVRFAKKEEQNLANMVDVDPHYIQDVLEANDFETLFTIERNGSFGMDFDENDGHLILQQVREVPSLDDSKSAEWGGLCWRQVGQRDYKLDSPNFYLACAKRDSYNILAPR